MPNLKTFALACAALAPTTALADWNGFYGGISFGQFSSGEFTLEGAGTADIEDANTFGVFIGSMTQSGQLVYGGELELMSADETEINSGRGDVIATPIVDLKTRVGYALNDVLPYGVLSLSSMSIDGPLSDNVSGSGFGFGVGVDYMVTENFRIGAEYLSRRTTGEVEVEGFFGTRDIEIDSDNFSIRAAVKF